jgi:hypothetical protein
VQTHHFTLDFATSFATTVLPLLAAMFNIICRLRRQLVLVPVQDIFKLLLQGPELSRRCIK